MADLSRSQADPGGSAHGLDHVIDQSLQILIEGRNRPRLFPQDRLPVPQCQGERKGSIPRKGVTLSKQSGHRAGIFLIAE